MNLWQFWWMKEWKYSNYHKGRFTENIAIQWNMTKGNNGILMEWLFGLHIQIPSWLSFFLSVLFVRVILWRPEIYIPIHPPSEPKTSKSTISLTKAISLRELQYGIENFDDRKAIFMRDFPVQFEGTERNRSSLILVERWKAVSQNRQLGLCMKSFSRVAKRTLMFLHF